MRTVLIWAGTAFVAISAQQVSRNGRCGPEFGNRVCKGSSYGDCCSQYGWCGSTSGHCGTGCQSTFGTCVGSGVSSTIRSSTLRTSTIPNTRSSSIAPSSTRTSSTAIASPSIQVSKNARCGNSNGASGDFTCKGSAYGNCCSQYSYCGSTSAYCGTGCQPGFGTCSGISSSVRLSSTSSMRSSSASSSAQSSSVSSSITPVFSSTQVSSSVSTQVSSSTSSSIAVSSTSSSMAVSSTSSTPSVTLPTQIVVNPSFEIGDGLDPTGWTVDRLYIIDAGNTGRVQSNPHTGSYSIRGRGLQNGGYQVILSQVVTVVPGASYNIEVFAKQTTDGFCSISTYFGDQTVGEFVPPGISYTSIPGIVNIPAGGPVQEVLMVYGACTLPTGDPQMYDLFIDDVTMTLVV